MPVPSSFPPLLRCRSSAVCVLLVFGRVGVCFFKFFVLEVGTFCVFDFECEDHAPLPHLCEYVYVCLCVCVCSCLLLGFAFVFSFCVCR